MKNFDEFYERMNKVCESLKEEEKMTSKLWEILDGCDTAKFFILMKKVKESKTNKEYYRNFDAVCSVNDKYRDAANLLTYFDLKAMHICELQDRFKNGESISWKTGCDMVIPCTAINPITPKKYKIDIVITYENFIDYILFYTDWEVK